MVGGQGAGPGGDGGGLAGQREDRAVVVGVAVQVPQGRAGGRGELGQDGVVAALGDVDDTLDDHGRSTITRLDDRETTGLSACTGPACHAGAGWNRFPTTRHHPAGMCCGRPEAPQGLLGDDGV